MADVKISELTAASSVGKTDLIEIVQSSTNKKATLQLIADLFGLEYKKVTLTASNIQSLGTAFELVAAPGSGKIHRVIEAFYQIRPGVTPFDTNTSLQIFYGTSLQSATSNTNFLATTEDSIVRPTMTTGSFNVPVASIVNQNINIKASGGNPLNGNGEVDVYLFYKTITL